MASRDTVNSPTGSIDPESIIHIHLSSTKKREDIFSGLAARPARDLGVFYGHPGGEIGTERHRVEIG